MKITRDHVKTGAKFVVGSSVSFTVNAVLRNNAASDKTYQQVEIVVGSCVIGWMVAEKAEDWTDAKIDAILNSPKVKQDLDRDEQGEEDGA